MIANKQQIIDLETRFWQSMKDKDVPTAQSLIARECLITGPIGRCASTRRNMAR